MSTQDGKTPLIIGSLHRQKIVVQQLIDCKAQVNSHDKVCTVSYILIYNFQITVVKFNNLFMSLVWWIQFPLSLLAITHIHNIHRYIINLSDMKVLRFDINAHKHTLCSLVPRPFTHFSMLHAERGKAWEAKSCEHYCTIALYSKV